MRRQLPWKLEFATLVKCVGGVLSPRSAGCHLSWSITDRLKPISHPHTSNPRLQAAHKFLLDFAPLRIFSKMFLTTEIAQISPGGLIWPTLQSEKKTFGGKKKKAHSLFSGPYYIFKSVSAWISRADGRDRNNSRRWLNFCKFEIVANVPRNIFYFVNI